MFERDQTDLVSIGVDRKRRTDIKPIEDGDRVFVADERDDRIFAPIERDVFEIDGEIVFVTSAQRVDAVGMRSDGKTLEIVRGTMNADNHVNRLRWSVRMQADAHADVLAVLEEIARAIAPIADHDVAKSHRREWPLAFRL